MIQCKSADCTNAFIQNELIQKYKLLQPLPEITTKNSTDIYTNPSIIPSEQLTQKNNSYMLQQVDYYRNIVFKKP